jgi:hypothetical protein
MTLPHFRCWPKADMACRFIYVRLDEPTWSSSTGIVSK